MDALDEIPDFDQGLLGDADALGASAILPRSYLVREAYSRVSVLIVMTSPSLTKCGTCTTSPVSVFAGFKVLVTAAVLIPGSVSTTLTALARSATTVGATRAACRADARVMASRTRQAARRGQPASPPPGPDSCP